MTRATRVLHVVGRMVRGGVETWLMQILRNTDRRTVEHDFLVHLEEPGPYDEEIRALGGRIIVCSAPRNHPLYFSQLWSVLRSGAYDVLHSHVHHFSGLVLAVGAAAGIPIRIAHSHNELPGESRWTRRAYNAATEALIRRFATTGMAASSAAARSLFDSDWETDERWRIQRCSIDLTPYRTPVDRCAIRKRMGLDSRNIVFGHVGRFDVQKNHAFLLEIAAATVKQDGRARFVLVGDGPLRSGIQIRAEELRIRDNVLFVGLRDDVPLLLRGCFDAFVLPSLHEGLPLVAIEAQAAGLPFVVSDRVTPEACIAPRLCHPVALSRSADEWAKLLLEVAENGSDWEYGLGAVERSDFNLVNALPQLLRAYRRPAARV